jgi:hypothetical protein
VNNLLLGFITGKNTEKALSSCKPRLDDDGLSHTRSRGGKTTKRKGVRSAEYPLSKEDFIEIASIGLVATLERKRESVPAAEAQE